MMTAGLDMMSRFLIFKNSMAANGCVCPKLAEIEVSREIFPYKLLGSTVKSTKLLERTGGKG